MNLFSFDDVNAFSIATEELYAATNFSILQFFVLKEKPMKFLLWFLLI